MRTKEEYTIALLNSPAAAADKVAELQANAIDLNEAFQYAAEYGQLEVVTILSKMPGIYPADNKDYAIRMAAKNGHLETVKFLCGNSVVDPLRIKGEAVYNAASNGHLDIVKFFLSLSRVKNSKHLKDLLNEAACNGHVEIVELLCSIPAQPLDSPEPVVSRHKFLTFFEPKKVVDPKIQALESATKNGHIKTVEFLCSQPGVEPSKHIGKLLKLAVEKGEENWELVKYLSSFAKDYLPFFDALQHAKELSLNSVTGHKEMIACILSLPVFNAFDLNLPFADKKLMAFMLKFKGLDYSFDSHRAQARKNLGFLFFADPNAALTQLPSDVKLEILKMGEKIDNNGIVFS